MFERASRPAGDLLLFGAKRNRLSGHSPLGRNNKNNNNEKGPLARAFSGYGTAYFFSSASIAAPRSAGERTVFTPAASSALNFSSAVPLPPEMIAPA